MRNAIDEGRFGVAVPTREALTVEQLLKSVPAGLRHT